MAEIRTKKRGVLLVNLGSPKAPTTREVRKYLREFLGDKRVVNLPRPLWLLILNLFVLPFRPKKSAHAYRSIWTEQGSPLIVLTEQLTAKLRKAIGDAQTLVDCAMRYGQPKLVEKLTEFKQQGVEELVIVPLYPQFSSTTTATVFDVIGDELKRSFHFPSLRFIGDYYEHPQYIAALANSIRAHWQNHGRNQLLLLSFHGLPAKLTELGDPYFHHCQTTGQLLAQALDLKPNEWQLVFQSRFGKAEWLKPYCVEVLKALPGEGIKTIDVVCPGFAVDCLETLEEIAITNSEIFIAAGGQSYRYIPCLNDSDAHVEMLAALVNNA